MASVIKRRLKSGIAYYGKYDAGTDSDGKTIWKMIPTGQPSRGKAATWIDNYEKEEKRKREHPEEQRVFETIAETWLAQIDNRSASQDRLSFRKHVLPRFTGMRIADITVPTLTAWAREMKAAGAVDGARFTGSTQRKMFALLSRFLSWCVVEQMISTNPCRDVPGKARPKQTAKQQDAPWISDEGVVRKIVDALRSPVNKPQQKRGRVKPIPPQADWFPHAFYLANRAGLRMGEVLGLRISDIADIDQGDDSKIRVRYSFDGPLKEDRGDGETAKVKYAPAPDDAPAFMAPWLARREAEGAQPEDYLFPPLGAPNYADEKTINRTRQALRRAFKWAAERVGVTVTWYEGSRHSFVSRQLSAGASLDEVSAAIGHSSPVVTRRYYDHFIRKSFSSTLRRGIGLTADEEEGKIISLGARHGAQVDSEIQSDASKPEKQEATS